MTTESELPILVAFHTLRDLGASKIVVEYAGEGDSGYINSCKAFDDGNNNLSTWADFFESIQESVEGFVYDKVLARLPDWVNNEGGYGTATIDLRTFAVTCEHHQNTEESHECKDVTLPAITPRVQQTLTRLRNEGINNFTISYRRDGIDPWVYSDSLGRTVSLTDSDLDGFRAWAKPFIKTAPDPYGDGFWGYIDVDLTEVTPCIAVRHIAYERGEVGKTIETTV